MCIVCIRALQFRGCIQYRVDSADKNNDDRNPMGIYGQAVFVIVTRLTDFNYFSKISF